MRDLRGDGDGGKVKCGKSMGAINGVEISCDLKAGHAEDHAYITAQYENFQPKEYGNFQPKASQPPTLRDQFAMVALTGLLPLWANVVDEEVEEIRLDVVTEAYAIADAMLVVRLK